MKITFGTRGSALALAQTRGVIARFKACNPGVEVNMRIIKTTGDQMVDAPLSQLGGFGAFTREIENALLAGEIDVAVHSLKDLPVQQPDGLRVAAIVERKSPTDVLISNSGYTLETLPKSAKLGTSSLRRKMMLLRVRPDLEIVEIRGNVPTRLSKVREGQCDAIVMAHAGLVRLGLDAEPGIQQIPFEQMLPAPGQGALALETRSDDSAATQCLAPLHDARAAAEVCCERAILKSFGGGCRAPLGAYARSDGDRLIVNAVASDPDLRYFASSHRVGTLDQAESLGNEMGRELQRGLGVCGQ